MSEYASLREESRNENWHAAAKEANRLRDLYQSLREDPRYNDEYRAETAWRAYEQTAPKIEAYQKEAREKLQKEAASAGRYSVPLPRDASYMIKDSSELLAIQGETNRILDRVEKLSQGPLPVNKAEQLRREYGEALQGEGIEASVRCKAILRAAESLGVPVDSIVADYRKPHHVEALERSQTSARMAEVIGGRVPQPPFPRPADVQPQSLRDILSGGNNRRYPSRPQGRKRRVS